MTKGTEKDRRACRAYQEGLGYRNLMSDECQCGRGGYGCESFRDCEKEQSEEYSALNERQMSAGRATRSI